MTALYRFKTDLREFVLPGHIEKAHGLYVIRAWASSDEAFAVQQMINRRKPVGIEAIVGDEVVMPGRAARVMTRADGNKVEISCILAA